MDASHMILGHPWQFDIDATHCGKENMSFTKIEKSLSCLSCKIIFSDRKKKGNGHKAWGALHWLWQELWFICDCTKA